MTIVELGAIGEFVGSIAVLATLGYLAVQVNQTKRAVQSASLQTGIATMTQNSQNVAADPDYSEIVVKGFFDSSDLNATDWFRFGLWMTCMFHVFQQYFLDSEKGLGDARVWAGEERAMKDLLAMPGVARWWREMPALPFSDVFIEHVNAVLSSSEETEQFRKLRERLTSAD